MTNNRVERFRIEATDDAQGGWVSFDWENGTMAAKWDNGQTETWSRRGFSVEAKAASFFMFTGQIERYLQAI